MFCLLLYCPGCFLLILCVFSSYSFLCFVFGFFWPIKSESVIHQLFSNSNEPDSSSVRIYGFILPLNCGFNLIKYFIKTYATTTIKLMVKCNKVKNLILQATEVIKHTQSMFEGCNIETIAIWVPGAISLQKGCKKAAILKAICSIGNEFTKVSSYRLGADNTTAPRHCYVIRLEQGWATYTPRAILVRPARPLEEKVTIWMNIMCTFARVVGAARDRNRNSFSARSMKKVAHHWLRVFQQWVRSGQRWVLFKLNIKKVH